jgi:hypothetical protein
MRSYLKKTHHKKGLVEWLKVQALSSNPSTTKKKKRLWVQVAEMADREGSPFQSETIGRFRISLS